MDLLRGDVWWVNLDSMIASEINKTRPCVIVSTNPLNQRRRTVVIVPLSTSPTARPPLTIRVISAGKPAVAITDQIQASAKERFKGRVGSLSEEEMEAIEDGLLQILGIR